VVVLYRTVHHDPPTQEDFRSGKALGVPKPSVRKERYWLGFSAYDSFERANATALAYPHQGDFIADLVIPDAFIETAAGGITIARSFGMGHWTVWGESALFVPLVARTIPVRWKEHGDHAGTL